MLPQLPLTTSLECVANFCLPLTFWRLYAFDVHCNSFFPMFVLLYGKLKKYISYWVILQKTNRLLLIYFIFCSRSLFLVTSAGSSWFCSCTTIKFTLHGSCFLLPLPKLFRLWRWVKHELKVYHLFHLLDGSDYFYFHYVSQYDMKPLCPVEANQSSSESLNLLLPMYSDCITIFLV